ncbi:hypothetical protein E7T09_07870 [Deinococcus sp. KSM4-11]|uniref:hypothetical protein n=1 Tax=Deinococcus sp. KSM4-11 TaxID=2568654 RepID=UPI0010A40EA2|nr:hypothetical protein [Deinococcus sp. KSM4-11]THF87077.1 hypothetical protein E7T09_07870 [Deinococcus sp. KSM4-11]
MPERRISSEGPKRARAEFEAAAWTLCDLARDPRCPRLPDDAWDALLHGQRTSDEEELSRYARILRVHLSRLGMPPAHH